MSYTLDELYKAIAKTERTIGNYQMSDETEYGSGSIYFYNKNMSFGNPAVGKYIQIYASPAWEQFYDDDTIIDKLVEVDIAMQAISINVFNDINDEFFDTDNKMILTGNLEVDIDAYYDAMRKAFSINNID